jgi:hypothetical protein
VKENMEGNLKPQKEKHKGRGNIPGNGGEEKAECLFKDAVHISYNRVSSDRITYN